MKFSHMHFLVIIISSLFLVSSLTAQEHLLNYQGRLTEDGAPFDGETDISFTLYDAETGGNELWSEKHSLEVQNGIFNVLLGSLEDFPRNIFSVNDELYLGITVNDGDEMEPRSRITSVVYAARSAVAATVDDGVITGGKLVDDIDIMTSGTIEASTFMGDGSELTGIVADHISPESVGSEELADGAITSDKLADDIDIETSGKIIADIYLINGWIGTEEEESVEVRVNNEPVLKILPEFFQEDFLPNVVIGSSSNEIEVGEFMVASTISGGTDNTIEEAAATISGGRSNQVNGFSSTIGGGSDNSISGSYSGIGGGRDNMANGSNSTIGGGRDNSAIGDYSTIIGGWSNEANGIYSTIGGGRDNTADGDYSFVAGGYNNIASGNGSFVSGGELSFHGNEASGRNSFVGGGNGNTASANNSFVGGGRDNTANASGGFIAGGNDNFASGPNAFVGGGSGNEAMESNSFAAGQTAKANHTRTFVWSGEFIGDFESTANSQFLIEAGNGVGINTNDPGGFDLAVNGTAANTTGQWSVFSDARLKHNIENLDYGMLDRLLSLHGYTFEYNSKAIEGRIVNDGKHIGLLAQEVEQVFPEWVDKDKEGYYFVTERGFTAIVIEALRELREEKDAEIAILKQEKNSKIEQLIQRLNKLENVVSHLKDSM